jgi:hypothetical protein
MDQQETPLEVLQQHIVETKARIARQEALVAEVTGQTEALLRTFKETLRFLREDLEMLETKLHRLTSRKAGD